jgi:hypothetical protein
VHLPDSQAREAHDLRHARQKTSPQPVGGGLPDPADQDGAMRALADVADALRGARYAAIPAVFGTSWVSVVDTEFDAAKQRAYEIAVTNLHKALGRGDYSFPIPQTWLVDPEQDQLNWATARRAELEYGTLAGVGTFRQHFPRLQALLRRTEVLVGWNVGNDKNILEVECRRNGLTYGQMKWVDLGQMYKLLRLETTMPTLSQACEHYGIVRETGEAHYAVYDAIATAELLAHVCDEWLTEMNGRAEELQILISGFLGNGGWDPRFSELEIRPAPVQASSNGSLQLGDFRS